MPSESQLIHSMLSKVLWKKKCSGKLSPQMTRGDGKMLIQKNQHIPIADRNLVQKKPQLTC
jgi:hypothetical protein